MQKQIEAKEQLTIDRIIIRDNTEFVLFTRGITSDYFRAIRNKNGINIVVRDIMILSGLAPGTQKVLENPLYECKKLTGFFDYSKSMCKKDLVCINYNKLPVFKEKYAITNEISDLIERYIKNRA